MNPAHAHTATATATATEAEADATPGARPNGAAEPKGDAERDGHGHRSPVFLDATGTRRQIVMPVGAVLGVLCVVYLAMVGVGLVGDVRNPITPWPISHLIRHPPVDDLSRPRFKTIRAIGNEGQPIRRTIPEPAFVPAPLHHRATVVPHARRTPRRVHSRPKHTAKPSPSATPALPAVS